jgi:hypothetical protein
VRTQSAPPCSCCPPRNRNAASKALLAAGLSPQRRAYQSNAFASVEVALDRILGADIWFSRRVSSPAYRLSRLRLDGSPTTSRFLAVRTNYQEFDVKIPHPITTYDSRIIGSFVRNIIEHNTFD